MKTSIYNVIIIDQSGSMDFIKKQAMSGYNETIQMIKSAQKEFEKSQEQFVTLALFNSEDINTVYDAVPCYKAEELNDKTFRPYGGTPLYDAIGITLSKFRYSLPREKKYKVLVTIITDGEENSSKEYSGMMISNMIQELSSKGWVFTYIGANQDVEKVATTISITNVMQFETSEAGTQEMFETERSNRKRWYGRVADGESDKELTESYFYNKENN